MTDRRTILDLLATARTKIDRLTPHQALTAQATGAIIIDTRDVEDRRAEGVVPGSVHVPLSVLPWRADPVARFTDPRLNDLNRRLIVICNDGFASSLAAATLVEIGFSSSCDIDGGFRAWAAAALPLEAAL